MNRSVWSAKSAYCTAFAAALSVLSSAAWAGPPSVWTPDAKRVKQLAPLATTDAYQIQLPKGYTLETKLGPGGVSGKAWASAPRADGTRVFVMLMTLTPPPSETKTYTLSEVSEKLLAGVHRTRSDWKQAPSETGTVNGLTFIRTHWQGTEPVSGLPMQGFLYVAQDGKTFLALSSQDIDTYAKTTLPLTEASVLTFKKK